MRDRCLACRHMFSRHSNSTPVRLLLGAWPAAPASPPHTEVVNKVPHSNWCECLNLGHLQTAWWNPWTDFMNDFDCPFWYMYVAWFVNSRPMRRLYLRIPKNNISCPAPDSQLPIYCYFSLHSSCVLLLTSWPSNTNNSSNPPSQMNSISDKRHEFPQVQQARNPMQNRELFVQRLHFLGMRRIIVGLLAVFFFCFPTSASQPDPPALFLLSAKRKENRIEWSTWKKSKNSQDSNPHIWVCEGLKSS